MNGNVLQLQEVGDFEAQNCQPSMNFDRSTKLDLTIEPPISYRCCYGLVFIYSAFSALRFFNVKITKTKEASTKR